MTKGNRLMALMSLWGIILVVLGHSGFEEPLVKEKLLWLNTWIYMFHMPLFFFISGYLYSLTQKDFTKIDSKAFLKKKFIRLFVPYLVLGLIVFVIKYGMTGIIGSSRSFSLQDFFMMFIAPRWPNSTMGYLWFIGTLFFLFVVISILGSLKVNLRKPLIAVSFIVVLWIVRYFLSGQELWIRVFNLQALTWYFPFFIIGILYQMNETKIISITDVGKNKTLFLFLLTLLGTWLLMHSYPVRYLQKILFAIIGVCFSMALCSTLLKNDFVNQRILPFGNITYTIYLMSFFGQYSVKVVVWNVLHLNWPVLVSFMFIGGLIFPLIVYWLYIKTNNFGGNKFVKILIGA